MKQDYTMYTYKADQRTKSGERLICVRVYALMREEEMQVIAGALMRDNAGWRCEFVPATKTVRNLMTGEMVEIPHDTPRSCDPSSELYWSM